MATDFAEIGETNVAAEPIFRSSRHTPLVGHANDGALNGAAGQPPSDEGRGDDVNHSHDALVGNLVHECRRYVDLRRAHQRLLLQAMAACRYWMSDSDKTAAAKLYKRVLADPSHPLAVWLIPYFDAMRPLAAAVKAQEKTIAKLSRQLPVWGWAEGVSGLSDRFLGLIVGECGAPVGDFKSVAAVWKRMGLAVIDGGRQRKMLGNAAIAHGYVARRRALMWNIGESILKQQLRKNDAGERYAIGEYGQVYIDRRAVEEARCATAGHAHNAAKRYTEKRLLRELWKAWRDAA